MYQVTGVPPNSAGRIRPTANRDQGQQDQFTYDYDPAGNRLTSFEQGNNTTYTPNNLNQYDFVNGTDYAYDLNGNLTDDGTNTYVYDFENHLISVDNGQSIVNYTYDPLGRRSTKYDVRSTTLFIHDQDHIIEDYTCDPNFSACALVRSYLYSNRIDELLQVTSHTAQVTSYYVHHDALGNTIAITDKDQNLIETYQYDPYGNPHFFNANGEPITESQIGNRYLWTGREWIEEIRKYDLRRRTEDPFLGRFMQRDFVNHVFDLNVYRYVDNVGKESSYVKPVHETNPYLYTGNDPVNRVDPFGLAYIEINPSVGSAFTPQMSSLASPKSEGICQAQSQEGDEFETCYLIDKGPTVCQYMCLDGRIETIRNPNPPYEDSCPNTAVFKKRT